jgi:hypothetical protein
MPEAFPLQWPEDWKRTHPNAREKPRYRVTDGQALKFLEHALRLFRATNIVISSNIELKRNGEMYANQARSTEDPGVAVYYSTAQFKDRVIACDKWQRVYHNAYAIGKALEALRAVDRAGASQILDRVFTAFGALPAADSAPAARPWWEVLGVKQQAIEGGFVDLTMMEAKFRELAKSAHPDRNGGSDAAFVELNAAIAAARVHFG